MTFFERAVLDEDRYSPDLREAREEAARHHDSTFLICDGCDARWFRDINDPDWDPSRDYGWRGPGPSFLTPAEFGDTHARGWVAVYALAAGSLFPNPIGVLCAECAACTANPATVPVLAERILDHFVPQGLPS